jgi:hypothetical protein
MAATLAQSGGMLPRQTPVRQDGGNDDNDDDDDDQDGEMIIPPGDVQTYILPDWVENPFQQQGNKLQALLLSDINRTNDDDNYDEGNRQAQIRGKFI